jgi:type IV pilus assembly protein PilB
MSAQPAEDGAERLIIRFLDPALKLEKPKDLGFSEALVEKVRSLSASKKGLILAAGPPFSGVTTLRTALMRCTDAYVYSIYYLADTGGKDISHVKVFPALEGDELTQTMTRAKREDADVLVMDPITTAENATAMLQFAEDCAIVTETSAKDAADALVRLVHLAGNPQLVADNVKLVASQLLVRLLCKKCKRAYRPNPKLLGKIGLPPETKVLYRAHTASEPVEGEQDEEEETCDECQGTGYKGRFGLLEVIEMSDGMKEALLAGADGKTLRAKARAEKMQTYQSDGLRAVVSGNTSLEELQRSFKATS